MEKTVLAATDRFHSTTPPASSSLRRDASITSSYLLFESALTALSIPDQAKPAPHYSIAPPPTTMTFTTAFTPIPPRCHFLFIDDLPLYTTILSHVMKPFSSAPSTTFSTIEEALDHLRTSPNLPHVLFSDINLGIGQLSGFDLIQIIRQEFPRLIVIAYTGEDSTEFESIEDKCLRLGFDGYLNKKASRHQIYAKFIEVFQTTQKHPDRFWPPCTENSAASTPSTTTTTPLQ